jgi:hypothetical protein
MKKLVTIALAMALVLGMGGMVFAGGEQGGQSQNGSANAAVIGGVLGGGGGIGCSFTSAQAVVGVNANAGISKHGTTFANLNATGASQTQNFGRNTLSAAIFAGGGAASAQTGGRR